MQTTIQKWGNSPALRLPKSFLKSAGYEIDQPVLLKISRGRIVIEPAPTYRLEDLVNAITDENRHDEIDFGPPQGREVW